MDLSIYDVIIGPRITTKVYRLNKELKQLVLKVHPFATKPMIAEALKKLFNVESEKIRVIVSKGKVRTVKRRVVQGKKTKKAIITLKEGYSVDMMDWSPTINSSMPSKAA
jgi:large subunit ribosomal protein L23